MSQNSFKVKNGLTLEPKVLGTIVSPQNGDIACDANDSNKIKYYDSTTTSWKPMGGGAPSLDTVFQLFAEEPISSWTMFTPGGQGSFVKVTSGQLHGDASYRMTLGTFNNLLSGPIQAVDPRFRGNTATLYFPYTFDGTNTDLRIQLIANPSGTPVNLIPDDIYVQGTNGGNGIYKINVNIPVDCTQIQFRVSQIATNIGKIFNFDDIQLTTDKTIYANIANITPWTDAGTITIGAVTTAPTKGTTAVDVVRWRQVGENYEVEYRYRQTSAGTAGSGDYLFSLPSGVVFDDSIPNYTGAGRLEFISTANMSKIDASGLATLNDTSGGPISSVNRYSATQFRAAFMVPFSSAGTISNTLNPLSSTTTSYNFSIKFKGRGLFATSPTIVLANETFSTDSASLTYASSSQYTLSTLANAPVGTFITYTYAANTNTRTQTSTAPTQSVSDMNANGIQIFTRAYNAASTAAQPACVAIQIGKGMKGTSLNLYKSLGKVTSGSLDWGLEIAGTDYGARGKYYDEVTGILTVDAGIRQSNITTSSLLFSDNSNQTNGYLTINASKSPALSGLNLPNVLLSAASTSAQNVTNTPSTRTFNIINQDTYSAFNGTSYTIPETGLYYIKAAARSTNAGGSSIALVASIVVNSVVLRTQVELAIGNACGWEISDVIKLVKGDVVTLSYSLGSVGTITPTIFSSENFITITKVGF